MIDKGNVKITGWWDGEPIWRQKTISERLLEELRKPHDKKQSKENKPKEGK